MLYKLSTFFSFPAFQDLDFHWKSHLIIIIIIYLFIFIFLRCGCCGTFYHGAKIFDEFFNRRLGGEDVKVLAI